MIHRMKASLTTLTILLVVGVRAADVPLDHSRVYGQCGLTPYDISEEIIKKNRLNTSDSGQIQKFWERHIPAAYRYDWRNYFRPNALRQGRIEPPIKEPVVIRLKVLYDETLVAQHPNVDTLRRYIRNVLLDVQMVFWQPELYNSVKIQLMVVELAQLDRKLELDDTMQRMLESVETYNPRADNSTGYYDIIMVFFYRTIYDFNPFRTAKGVANSYTFCNRDSGSRGILIEFTTSSVMVIAHEMGHTLGMMHDGEEPNRFSGYANCDPKGYIMAAYLAIDQNQWSLCSVQALLSFLRRPKIFECVIDKNRTRHAKPLSPQFDWPNPRAISLLPGQEMPPEEQCILSLGEPARPKRGPSNRNKTASDTKIVDSCVALFCELHGRFIYVGPSQGGSPCLTYPRKLEGRCIDRNCTDSYPTKPVNTTTLQGIY